MRILKIGGTTYGNTASTISLTTGTQYAIAVETSVSSNKFKGALLRIQCDNTDDVTVTGGTTGQVATACNFVAQAKGITHKDSILKESVDGVVTVNVNSKCALDVTVVDFNTASDGSRYWYSRYTLDFTSEPDPPTSSPIVCFAGETEVTVQEKGPTRMDQLQIGDKVLTSHVDGGYDYASVYSFGHRAPSLEATFLQIVVEHNKPLEISLDHMLYRYDDAGIKADLIPASYVKVGDTLVVANGETNAAKVQAVHKVTRVGMYAPFTGTGDIVVNHILASNYIAIPGVQKYLTFEQQHWLQHTAYTPYRWFCFSFGCENEAYDNKYGVSVGVRSWLPVLHFVEFLLQFHHVTLAIAASAAAAIMVHWMAAKTKSKIKTE